MSKLQSALRLSKQGFRVFPLVPNGKIPAITGDWQEVATRDPAKIERLWTDPVFGTEQDYNIGIALDRDVIVVDVDTRDGKKGDESLRLWEACNEQLPETYTVTTASGGQHRYFSVDDSSGFPKELCKHVDLKGYGGYVVAPGSTIGGNGYVGVRSEMRPLPAVGIAVDRVARDAKRKNSSGNALSELDTPDAIKRATAYLATAPDSGTFKVACRVKDFGISQETALELMAEHWQGASSREHDHIAFRVENAYRYGQSPPGIASPEAEFEAVEPAPAAGTAQRRGLYAIRWVDDKPELDRPYLIDEVMDSGAMAVTYGDSNVGKTFVVLDQAFHIAAGRDWNGHKVRPGLVVYVASEGGKGFSKRIEAYKRHYGVKDIPFSLVPCPIDLHATGDANDTGRLIRLIRGEEAHFGQKCALIVVDTLARAMGGGDENTSVDMGLMVGHCDRLRAATGAAINLIHHTGKDKSKGARGSSALRAATDTEIEIDDGLLSIQKQRDMGKADDMRFELDSIEIGARTDGRPVSACVVRWVAVTEFEERLSSAAKGMLDVFDRLIEARTAEIEEDESLSNADKADLLKRVKVPWDSWQMSVLSCQKGPRGKKLNRTALYPLRQELSDSGLVAKDAKNQWFRP